MAGLLVACQTATPAGSPATEPVIAPTDSVSSGNHWQPKVGETWEWNLTGEPVDPDPTIAVYDIDGFAADADQVAALHAQGSAVICYLSVGSWEDWRPDADQFPPEVIGNDYEGWPGEKWLDIRQIDALAPVMLARMDMCRDKGFDAVEPDNIGSFLSETGFELTEADQLRYDRWLAAEAHARGMTIGLKNSPEHAAVLVDEYDWALTESCFIYEWCEAMLVFVEAGKPVFVTEYTDTDAPEHWEDYCTQGQDWGFSMILKNRNLDNTYRVTCP